MPRGVQQQELDEAARLLLLCQGTVTAIRAIRDGVAELQDVPGICEFRVLQKATETVLIVKFTDNFMTKTLTLYRKWLRSALASNCTHSDSHGGTVQIGITPLLGS